jgi:uncharacterized protein (DUF1501 family)
MEVNERWFDCDGEDHVGLERPVVRPQISRRAVVTSAALGAVGWLAGNRALAQVTFSPQGGPRDVLVSVFLRGGADGLSMVVPYGDDAYHRARPVLRVPAPDDGGTASAARALDIDGFFGLHPSLAPLLPLFRDGSMAAVHACGSGDRTRSHFEAMNLMERGLEATTQGPASGWLARYLSETDPVRPTPVRAVAIGGTLPDSLRGATDAIALTSLDAFKLDADDRAREILRDLYGTGDDPFTAAGRETLEVLDSLRGLGPFTGSTSAAYPDTALGTALRQVAYLVKADVGLEVACVDKGGWDTHYGQNLAGLMPNLLEDLANSLAAFARDLGDEMSRVTVVVQTEFGRRLQENVSLGTDHGRASAMLLLGGGIAGGKVHAVWPGLDRQSLDDVGDLRVTTDYRTVLSEVLESRMGLEKAASIFDPLSPHRLGIAKNR